MSLAWIGHERNDPSVPEPRKQGWVGDLVLVIVLSAGMFAVLWWLLKPLKP
jgi:hypothetical protein